MGIEFLFSSSQIPKGGIGVIYIFYSILDFYKEKPKLQVVVQSAPKFAPIGAKHDIYMTVSYFWGTSSPNAISVDLFIYSAARAQFMIILLKMLLLQEIIQFHLISLEIIYLRQIMYLCSSIHASNAVTGFEKTCFSIRW